MNEGTEERRDGRACFFFEGCEDLGSARGRRVWAARCVRWTAAGSAIDARKRLRRIKACQVPERENAFPAPCQNRPCQQKRPLLSRVALAQAPGPPAADAMTNLQAAVWQEFPDTPPTPVYEFVDGVTGETRWSVFAPKLVMACALPKLKTGDIRSLLDPIGSSMDDLADLANADVPSLPDDFTETQLFAYDNAIGGFLSSARATSPKTSKRNASRTPGSPKSPEAWHSPYSAPALLRPVTPPTQKQRLEEQNSLRFDPPTAVLPLSTPQATLGRVDSGRLDMISGFALPYTDEAVSRKLRCQQIARRILKNSGAAVRSERYWVGRDA